MRTFTEQELAFSRAARAEYRALHPSEWRAHSKAVALEASRRYQGEHREELNEKSRLRVKEWESHPVNKKRKMRRNAAWREQQRAARPPPPPRICSCGCGSEIHLLAKHNRLWAGETCRKLLRKRMMERWIEKRKGILSAKPHQNKPPTDLTRDNKPSGERSQPKISDARPRSTPSTGVGRIRKNKASLAPDSFCFMCEKETPLVEGTNVCQLCFASAKKILLRK